MVGFSGAARGLQELQQPRYSFQRLHSLLYTAFNPRLCLFLLWLGLWPALFLSLRWPTASQLDGIAPVASALGLCTIGVLLCWMSRGTRAFLLGVVLLFGAVAVLPGSDEAAVVRQAYVSDLDQELGEPYAAGFEEREGINCSGLVRGTLVKTNLRIGLETVNPRLLREGIELWLDECSAVELGHECYGKLLPMLRARSIASIKESRLQPGDVAVTQDGRHSLAYLGERVWIQADPYASRVIRLEASSKNAWFHVPVVILRWTQLASPSS